MNKFGLAAAACCHQQDDIATLQACRSEATDLNTCVAIAAESGGSAVELLLPHRSNPLCKRDRNSRIASLPILLRAST